MPTKLSRFCDGVMEAGWLSAVIVVPLFFDVYSSRVFEPDKLAFLRTVALVVAVVWLVKIIEEGGPRFNHVARPPTSHLSPLTSHFPPPTSDLRPLTSILRLPLIAPVFALLVSLLLSTVLSVTPRVSFFGSYQRLQGTYTTLAYLVLFGSILANMRRRAQFDRLITAVILTGLPVSLYGMLQRFQLDPLPWGGDTVMRVSSTLGNPILLGAYLIMVLPITIGRVVESFGAILREAEGLVYHLIRATLYVFIASADLIALWLTGSRGPWLGFLAGSFFLLILLSSHWRLRWLTIGTIALAAVLGISLIVLNIPNGPLEPLRASPSLGRLGHVFETDKETGRVRVLIWQGASELVRPHAPLEYPDGHQDAFNFLRPLVGYGPESMYVAFNRFYPPELGQIERRNATPDRSHNETWDALVTTGALGLLVYLALFASILYYGVKWLGLIQSARQRNLFIGLYAGGGLAGAIALVAWQGLPFFGVGLPFGIMLGLIAYLTLLAIFAPPASVGTRLAPWRAIALSTLIAAVMAHFTEIHFGFGVAVSRTLFWMLTGLMGVVGCGLIPASETVATTAPIEGKKEAGRRKRSRPAQPASSFPLPSSSLANSGILATLLILLGFNFITNPNRLTSATEIIWKSFTTLPKLSGVTSYGILIVIALTWWLGGLLTASESARRGGPRAWATSLGVTLGVSLVMALIFWAWLGGELGSLVARQPENETELIDAVWRVAGLLGALYVAVFGLMLAMAAFLPEDWPRQGLRSDRAGAALAGLLTLTVIVAGYSTNLRVAQADVIYKTAEGWAEAQNWTVATRLYLLASALAPNEDYYYLYVGKGFLEIADRSTDPSEQATVFDEAKKRLLAAQALNPLNTDHTANLGRLYRWWASVAPNAAERIARAQTADGYYTRAVTLSPQNATLWDEWASLDLSFLDDRAGALEKLNHSLGLDAKYDRTYALLGDYHATLARAAGDPAEYAQAAEAYQRGIALTPDAISLRIGLGAVYSATGQNDRAIDSYSQAVKVAPPTVNLTNVFRALAELYRRDGDKGNALKYARLALSNAPDEMKPEIQKFIEELNAGR